MRAYGKLAPQFWTGETGKTIRAAGPQVQVIALYLVTSPSATMLGLYYLPLPTLCHEVGCSRQAAQKALGVLSRADFARYDERTEFVWVPNMARFQIGENLKPGDKRIAGIIKAIEGLKHTPFFEDFLIRYQRIFQLDGADPTDAPSMPLRSPSEAKSRNRSSRTEAGARDLSPTVDREFERFWNLYPKRSGKRLGKPEALKKWEALNTQDRQQVLVAVQHYASSELAFKNIGIKDPHRWLRSGKDDEPWRDWIEPEQRTNGKEGNNGKPQLPRIGFAERDYREGAF